MGESDLDRALVERVQKGDNRAFDLLVRKYQHKLVGVISRYVNDWSECQDVAQEAFVRAYRAIGSFRGDAQFYTWIYRIAINTAKNHLVSQGAARRPRTSPSRTPFSSTVQRVCTSPRRPSANSCARKLNEPCFPRSKNCLRSFGSRLRCARSTA
jgi:RNA polymerase sigma factor (sigma-70 family)